jgi:hypothetical protein
MKFGGFGRIQLLNSRSVPNLQTGTDKFLSCHRNGAIYRAGEWFLVGAATRHRLPTPKDSDIFPIESRPAA